MSRIKERVAIVGSRSPDALLALRAHNYVMGLPAGTEVITGDASGIDSIAKVAAGRSGLACVVHVAEWSKHGRSAGLVRNQAIVDSCDRVVAFPSWDSRGTFDTINKAKRAGKPVEIIR